MFATAAEEMIARAAARAEDAVRSGATSLPPTLFGALPLRF